MENGGRESHWMDTVIASKLLWRHFVLRKTTCDDIRGKLVDQNDMPSSYGMQEVVLAIEGKPGLALPHATCRIVTL